MAPQGLRLLPGRIDPASQAALVGVVMERIVQAPFYVPRMPCSGAAMRVRQTNFGPLGWITDRVGGYRYEARHPISGRPWPPIPAPLIELWAQVTGYRAPPEACLVNLYRGAAAMSLHVDRDEEARDAPVVSVSLGDDALFRIGGRERKAPTRSFWLRSGDVLVMEGEARDCFHGIDRIVPGSSSMAPGGGRINLTLRRVTYSDADLMRLSSPHG